MSALVLAYASHIVRGRLQYLLSSSLRTAGAPTRHKLVHLKPSRPISSTSTSYSSLASTRRLARLERDAGKDPERLGALLSELNHNSMAEEVVRKVERLPAGMLSPMAAETVGKEYMKALVMTNRIDRYSLQDVVSRLASGVSSTSSAAAAASSAGSSRYSGYEDHYRMDSMASPSASQYMSSSHPSYLTGSTGIVGSIGTTSDPVHVSLAEPTMKAQLWKTVRALGTTFLVLSGVGALMEERGLGKGFGINTDVQPEPLPDTPTFFSDVKGCDEAKAELEEVVHYLKSPAKFTRLGGKLPKGLLLVGPPGTGKTMLARAIAGEAGVPFFYASGSEFEEMFVGVGARRVREMFNAAKKHAPCIIFIDEIDAIGASRNPKDQQYMKMTLNQLLVELDGFTPTEGIIVIGATNFPETLDKALIRPGRFDRNVVVPLPDVQGRREILRVHTKEIPLAPSVNLDVIARGTPGFSGAELANLANMAALKAAIDGEQAVGMVQLEYAKDKIIMGAERKSAVISEESRTLTAYHEGGHAIVALKTVGAFPVHKATIVPRGQALGMVAQLPSGDVTSYSRKQMLAKLDVCMAGRVAEELIFGEHNVTSGAESDFDQATKLAEAMVMRFGMSEKLGHVVYDKSEESSETRAIIEAEVKLLLDSAYNRAKVLLTQHEPELHVLANELLTRETLTGEEVIEIIRNAEGNSTDAGKKEHDQRWHDSNTGIVEAARARAKALGLPKAVVAGAPVAATANTVPPPVASSPSTPSTSSTTSIPTTPSKAHTAAAVSPKLNQPIEGVSKMNVAADASVSTGVQEIKPENVSMMTHEQAIGTSPVKRSSSGDVLSSRSSAQESAR